MNIQYDTTVRFGPQLNDIKLHVAKPHEASYLWRSRPRELYLYSFRLSKSMSMIEVQLSFPSP